MVNRDSETIDKSNRAIELIDIAQRAKNEFCNLSSALTWLESAKMHGEAKELEQLISEMSDSDMFSVQFVCSLRAGTRDDSTLEKKRTRQSGAIRPILQQSLEPMALATALAETISEYVKAVNNGDTASPAYQRKEGNVVAIWSDTRLEALHHLWDYGASDASLLADHHQQKNLLDAFFEKKPQYQYPHQPSGDRVHDTLQALFQVYLFLSKAGSAVADNETDSRSLKRANKTIFSDFEQQAKTLWAQWISFEQANHSSGDLPPMPSTLLELLYKDVTRKAKTIALSARFGPDYEAGMNYLVHVVQKDLKAQGESEDSINEQTEQIRSTMKQVLAADDPDGA